MRNISNIEQRMFNGSEYDRIKSEKLNYAGNKEERKQTHK